MQRRRGFTLVELLTVIVMVILLVAILAPSLLGTRRLTQSIGCRKNLKDQGTALVIFSSEHNAAVPTHGSFYLPEGIGRYLYQPYQKLLDDGDLSGSEYPAKLSGQIKHAVRDYTGFPDADAEMTSATKLGAAGIKKVKESPSQYICPSIPKKGNGEQPGYPDASKSAYLHYGVAYETTFGGKREDHPVFENVPFVDMRQFRDLEPFLNTDKTSGNYDRPTDPYEGNTDTKKKEQAEVFSLKLAGATLKSYHVHVPSHGHVNETICFDFNGSPSEFRLASDSHDSLNGNPSDDAAKKEKKGFHGLLRHGGPSDAAKRTNALMLDGSARSVKTPYKPDDPVWGIWKDWMILPGK